MNKFLLLFGLSLSFSVATNAQNTFPTTGNTGIGTAIPQHSLHLKKTSTTNGDIKVDDGKITLGNVNDELVDGEYRSKLLTDGAVWMRSNFPFILLSLKDVPSSGTITFALAPNEFTWSNKATIGDAVIKAGFI